MRQLAFENVHKMASEQYKPLLLGFTDIGCVYACGECNNLSHLTCRVVSARSNGGGREAFRHCPANLQESVRRASNMCPQAAPLHCLDAKRLVAADCREKRVCNRPARRRSRATLRNLLALRSQALLCQTDDVPV